MFKPGLFTSFIDLFLIDFSLNHLLITSYSFLYSYQIVYIAVISTDLLICFINRYAKGRKKKMPHFAASSRYNFIFKLSIFTVVGMSKDLLSRLINQV